MRNSLNFRLLVCLLLLSFSIINDAFCQNSFRSRCPYTVNSWPFPNNNDWMGCPPATFTNQNGSLCPLNYTIKPFQDCCGAEPICNVTQNVTNQGYGSSSRFNSSICGQGCSSLDLPPIGTTCFATNERQTAWYSLRIAPLPGGSTALGAPAGKLRFKVIPCDISPNPANCDEMGNNPICNCDSINPSSSILCADEGISNIGNADFDWILFRVSDFRTRRSACNSISSNNSTVVCCNWSSYTGPTGMSEISSFNPSCDQGGQGGRYGAPVPVFVGELYFLAVDYYTVRETKSYKLDFSGACANTVLNGATAIIGGEQSTINNVDRIQVSRILTPTDSCSIGGFNFSFNQTQVNTSITTDKFKLFRLNNIGEDIDSNISITSLLPINSPIAATEWSLRTSRLPIGNYAIRYRDSILNNCGLVLNADTFSFRVGPAAPTITVVNADSCLFQPTTLRILDTNYFDFIWSNGSTADSAIVTGAGTYSVSVRRRGVCTERFTTTFNLTQPSLGNCPISININNRLDSLTASLSALRYQWELEGILISPDSRIIPVLGNGSYRVRAINNTDTGVWSAPFLVSNTREELTISTLKVYPNPAKGMVNIAAPASAQSIQLINPQGKVVLTKQIQGTTTINVQGLPNRAYIVRTKVGSNVLSEVLLVQ